MSGTFFFFFEILHSENVFILLSYLIDILVWYTPYSTFERMLLKTELISKHLCKDESSIQDFSLFFLGKAVNNSVVKICFYPLDFIIF